MYETNGKETLQTCQEALEACQESLEACQPLLKSCQYASEGWRISLDGLHWANSLVWALLVLLVVVLWWWDRHGQKRPGFDREMRWRVFLPWCLGCGWAAIYPLFNNQALNQFEAFFVDQPKKLGSLVLGLPQAFAFSLAGWTLLARKRRIHRLLGSFLPIHQEDKSLRAWRPRPVAVIMVGITLLIGTLIVGFLHEHGKSTTENEMPISAYQLLIRVADVFFPVFSLGLLGAGLFKSLNYRSVNVDSAIPAIILMLYALFQYIQLWVPVDETLQDIPLLPHSAAPILLIALLFKTSLLFSLIQLSITLNKIRKEKFRNPDDEPQLVYDVNRELQKVWEQLNDEGWHAGKQASLFPPGRLHNPRMWSKLNFKEVHPRIQLVHDGLNDALRKLGMNIRDLPADLANCVDHGPCWHILALKSIHRSSFEEGPACLLVAHFCALIDAGTWNSCKRCRAMEDETFVEGITPGKLIYAFSTLFSEDVTRLDKHHHGDDKLTMEVEFEQIRDASRFLRVVRGDDDEGRVGGLTRASRILRNFIRDSSVRRESGRDIGRVTYVIPTRRQ